MGDYLNDNIRQLWRVLSQTRNLVIKLRTTVFRKYNITLRQATTLMAIDAAKGNVTAYKIARWTVVETQTVSTTIDKLEKDGFIIKNKTKSKGNFELTNKGKAIVKQLLEVDPVLKLLSILTKRERAYIMSILMKLRDNALNEYGIKTRLPFPP